MLDITPLASGSKGNCTLVESAQGSYLIDCGVSFKALASKMSDLGKDIGKVRGIFITHEHTDHCSGARVVSNKLDLPIFANHDTAMIMKSKNRCSEKLRLFENGQTLFLDDIAFTPFSVPHDAVNTVAYTMESQGVKASVVTDLGSVTELVLRMAQNSHKLILEFNYDQQKLMDCGRPWRTIQRIMSRHGHLSNEQALEVLERLNHPDLQELYIGHISEDTNDYALVYDLVHKKLEQLGRADLQATIYAVMVC